MNSQVFQMENDTGLMDPPVTFQPNTVMTSDTEILALEVTDTMSFCRQWYKSDSQRKLYVEHHAVFIPDHLPSFLPWTYKGTQKDIII
jgi:hypothetical protein